MKKYFPSIDIVEVPATQYTFQRDKLQQEIKKTDIIIAHGGGNLGNQYQTAEDIRRDIIKRWPENRIIIFPQTIYFNSKVDNAEEELRKSQNIYNTHKNLSLFTREKQSYRFAKDNFACRVYLVPDIVLSMNRFQNYHRNDEIILCLRNDIEKNIDIETEKIIWDTAKHLSDNVKYIDTQKPYNISIDKREQAVIDFWELFSKARLVVTDRMHGMIFAAITKTPCVVLNNYNHKIRGTYDWIKDLPFIALVDNREGLETIIKELYSYNINEDKSDLRYLNEYYRVLVQVIKGNY